MKKQYLKNIKSVEKSTRNGRTVYNVEHMDGSGLTLSFVEGDGQESVLMYTIDVNGVHKRLKPKPREGNRKDLVIRRENSTVTVNELIYQFDRVARGLPTEDGEFNHTIPVCWQTAAGGEIMSTLAGTVCDKYVNETHWRVLSHIYNRYGIMCSCLAHNVVIVECMLLLLPRRSTVEFLISQGILNKIA